MLSASPSPSPQTEYLDSSVIRSWTQEQLEEFGRTGRRPDIPASKSPAPSHSPASEPVYTNPALDSSVIRSWTQEQLEEFGRTGIAPGAVKRATVTCPKCDGSGRMKLSYNSNQSTLCYWCQGNGRVAAPIEGPPAASTTPPDHHRPDPLVDPTDPTRTRIAAPATIPDLPPWTCTIRWMGPNRDVAVAEKNKDMHFACEQAKPEATRDEVAMYQYLLAVQAELARLKADLEAATLDRDRAAVSLDRCRADRDQIAAERDGLAAVIADLAMPPQGCPRGHPAAMPPPGPTAEGDVGPG